MTICHIARFLKLTNVMVNINDIHKITIAPNKMSTSQKTVTWDINVIENEQKRPCECLCCHVCQMNSKCGIFGKYKCIECKEWICTMCINITLLKCNCCQAV